MSTRLSKFYKEDELFSIYFLSDLAILNPRWMVEPEPDPALLIRPLAKYSVYIGRTEYGRLFYWDPEILLNPMIVVLGTPGAGKSFTLKTMLIRMKKEKNLDVPIIIVDPEGEYHVVVEQVGEGIVLDIGENAFINIFDRPFTTMSYRLWVRKAVIPGIIKALKVSPQQAPLMIRVLEKAIFDTYENKYGFNPADKRTWRKPDPTLADVIMTLESYVAPYREGRTKRKPPLYRTIESLLERLKRWAGGEGSDFFAYPSTINLRDLLRQSIVVFNIKKLPPDAQDLFTYYIFNYFYALMEMLPPLLHFGLRVFLVFDEAWMILKTEKGQESLLSRLYRLARKHGFAAVLATQMLYEVSKDILPLAATIFILNIQDAEAVEKLAKSLAIPQRLKKMIPVLPQGSIVVRVAWRKTEDYANATTPFLVRVDPAVRPMARVIVYDFEETTEDMLRALRATMLEKTSE